MKVGCCSAMVAGRGPAQEDRTTTGIELLKDMERIGFDYVELSLSDIMSLDEQEFESLRRRLSASTVKCEACHNLFPSAIKLTGPKADAAAALEYVGSAFRRASRLGAGIVVFGSSGARNVPPGFPYHSARKQIVELLCRIGALADGHSLTVVVEPLNRQESNIVNTLAEALDLCREVNHRRIKLLSDYYHLVVEKEGINVILDAGSEIRHVHISEPAQRSFPLEQKRTYREYFDLLRRVGYDDRVSIEAYTENFEADALRSVSLLRSLAGR